MITSNRMRQFTLYYGTILCMLFHRISEIFHVMCQSASCDFFFSVIYVVKSVATLPNGV